MKISKDVATSPLVLLLVVACVAAFAILGILEYRAWRHIRGVEASIRAQGPAFDALTGEVRRLAEVDRQRTDVSAALEALAGDVRLALELDRQRADVLAQHVEIARARDTEATLDIKRLRDQVACIAGRKECRDDGYRLADVYPWQTEFYDYSGRAEFALDRLGRRTAVIVIGGQSNAANYGAGYYFPRHYVRVGNLSIDNGKVYIAQEPLLGSDRGGSSFATRLADKLIASGLYDHVVLVPIAIGNSTAADWATGGRFNHRIAAAARRLKAVGLTATHVLWHQGESDASNPKVTAEDYAGMIESVVSTFRVHGVKAPFFIAKATYHENRTEEGAAAVREGQTAVVDPERGIFPGPDTDTLTGAMRSGGYHFSAQGLAAHAELWLAALCP